MLNLFIRSQCQKTCHADHKVVSSRVILRTLSEPERVEAGAKLYRGIDTIFICALLLTLTLPLSAHARRTTSSVIPTIIPRTAWGADESLGITNSDSSQSAQLQRERTAHPSKLSDREKKCRELIRSHPEDFKTIKTVEYDEYSRKLKWPRRYSKNVKLIVVHHSGEANGSTLPNLTGHEQVRAIYKTHTMQNGWGDIGYNYLIDSEGVIYEGRAGGEGVVGAHVYCANVGTVSVALIGNFQYSYPAQEQLMSLRKLSINLSDGYGINLRGRTVFRGKSMPTIVTHRDLAATQCAGRKVQKLMPKIRRLVASGDVTSKILMPKERPTSSVPRGSKNILTPFGTTNIRLPARGTASIKLRYHAKAKSVKTGESIAKVERSDSSLIIWQKRRGSKIRVRNDIRAERSLRIGDAANLNLTILAPRKKGKYSLRIGDVRYTVEVMGR